MRTFPIALFLPAIVCLSVHGADPVEAGAPESHPSSQPPPQLAQLDYLLGTWRCEGWDSASAWGSARRTRTTITAEKDLDDASLRMDWHEAQTAENPTPWKL